MPSRPRPAPVVTTVTGSVPPALLRLRPVVALLAVLALATGALLGLQRPAHAEPPVSTSAGRFLSGSLLGSDLDTLAEVDHAMTSNTGGATVVDNHPLGVGLLGKLSVPLGQGIDLLGGNPLLTLGAVAQYSSASPDGSSKSASGAVTDSGAIAVNGSQDYPANATLTLSKLIGSDLAAQVGDITLTTGALSALARQDADGAQTGSYQIAGLKLSLTSPLVAQIAGQVRTLLGSLQPVVDRIPSLVNALNLGGGPLGGVVSVSTPPTLTDLVGSLGDVTTADGAITASLTDGSISIDVGKLLAALGLDLNALPANTSLLPYVLDALSQKLVPALQGVLTGPDGVVSRVSAAINGVHVTLLGQPVSSAALTQTLNTVVGDVSTPLNAFAAQLGDTVVTPVANALSAVLGLTANSQQSADGAFTERALRVELLPGATSVLPAGVPAGPQSSAGAVRLNLATATVGPNAGPAAKLTPTLTALTPKHGPTTGGTKVTVTGTGFVAGKTTVTIGGNTVPASAVTVTSATSLSFPTPAHKAGPVTVTVTTPAGTSGPLGYTYDPATAGDLALGSLTPTHGPTSGGTVVTITGSGFVPGSTSVTIGDVTVPAAQVEVTSSSSLHFTTPAHAAGPVDVTVTTGAGTSAPLEYTYVPPAHTKPVITSPTDGSTISDPTPVITGTAGPGSTVTVTVSGGSGCTAHTTADGTWTCTATPALSDGAHTIVASSGGVDSDAVHVTLRTLAPTGGGTQVNGPGAPASTGFAALGFLALGVFLAVCGAALTVANRRGRLVA